MASRCHSGCPDLDPGARHFLPGGNHSPASCVTYGRTKSDDATLVRHVHYTAADGTGVHVEFK